MHSWFVLCFFLSMVALSRARVGFDGLPGPPGNTGLPGPPGKTGLTGPSGQKGTVTVKYCPISKTITTFLKQFRDIGLRGASGARGLSGQSGSLMVSYNVVHRKNKRLVVDENRIEPCFATYIVVQHCSTRFRFKNKCGQNGQNIGYTVISGEASPTFGHANANFSVFIDCKRNEFLKK